MDKIIFGITGLTMGGAERVLIDTANALVDKYDITIFTIYSKGELEKELKSNIQLISLYDFKYSEMSKIKKILMPLKVLMTRKRIYKKYVEKDDYIAQIAFLEGAITRIFSTKGKTKKIAWIHNDITNVFGKSIKAKIKKKFDKKIYEKYDTLVFVSKDNLDKFNGMYSNMKLPYETLIHNYIDPDRILKLANLNKEANQLINKRELNIVQISRLVEQKAIERLIKVHTKLIKKGYAHHIYIIGDGPLKGKLERQIMENGVRQSFTLLGAKQNPYPFMKIANAISLFSYFEGYPMVIEEAKILRKYILTTDTAAREVLINYPNCMVVPNDEDGIEKAIRTIIKGNIEKSNKSNDYKYSNDEAINKIVKIIEKKNNENLLKGTKT